MSETGWCILGFIFLLVTVLLLGILFRAVGVLRIPTIDDVLRLYRGARDPGEKLLVTLFAVFKLLRGGYTGALVAIASAGFCCLSTICGWWLNFSELRTLLLDLVDWFSR